MKNFKVNCIPNGNVVSLIFLCKNRTSVGCRSPPSPNFETIKNNQKIRRVKYESIYMYRNRNI